MTSPTVSKKLYSLLMFMVVSVLSGLLIAGLAVPFAAMAGQVSNSVATSMEDLPAELDTPPQSERSRIIMANGEVLATFYDENRIYVPLSKISPIMQKAQLAIEDHRFYEHGAIDPQGTLRALLRTTVGGETQGGSTLTQQYVKLVLVEAAQANGDDEGVRKAMEQTFERKVRELRYAIALEKKFTKDQILERYLNIAYYGEGAYGVEAAAHHYFGTTAAELTLSQAAMLAGQVQNPSQTNPVKNLPRATERRNQVLNRMEHVGWATAAEVAAAKTEKFDASKVTVTPRGCVTSPYPFLCDYVRRTLLSDAMPSLGKTPEERRNLLNRGGLTIQTLIDPKTQDAAEEAVNQLIKPGDPVISTSVLLQPRTGLIIAMAQSRPTMGEGPGETYFNYAVEHSLGGAEGYQAGSTFKVFTLAAALDQGFTPSRRYDSPSNIEFKGQTFKNCSGPFEFKQEYHPGNSTGTFGNINMYKAAEMSVNTYFVQLLRDVGICNAIDMATKAGVKMALPPKDKATNKPKTMRELYQNIPSFTLGVAEVTPLSMAEAYGTFANRGVHCTPIVLQKVTTKGGKQLAVPPANCKQVINPDVADGVNSILERVMKPGGTGARARVPGNWNQAGKTGTINDNAAVWFVGYTPEVVGSAMIAIDKTNDYYKDGNHSKSLKNMRLPSGPRLQGSGGGDAGLIWKASMATALEGKPNTKFHEPSAEIINGKKVPVPNVKGKSLSEAKTVLEAAGFTTRVQRQYSSRDEGSFLGISPSGTAVQHSQILLLVSRGPRPDPRPPVAPNPPPAQPAPPQPPPGPQPPENPRPTKPPR